MIAVFKPSVNDEQTGDFLERDGQAGKEMGLGYNLVMSIIIAIDVGGTQIHAAAFRRGTIEPVEMLRTPTREESPAFERVCTLVQSIWPEQEKVEKIVVASPVIHPISFIPKGAHHGTYEITRP
jgi:hypothetical protein